VSQAVHGLLSSRVESLVLGRRHHPDRGVQPCRVVPVHPFAGLPFNGPLVVWHPHCREEFGLVEAIDGLCERIVVGVAGGAHRGSKTSGEESGRVEERLNKEIRRRREVVGIFAGRASDICLVGALIIDWTEEWADERRSMSARGPCQGPTGTVPRR